MHVRTSVVVEWTVSEEKETPPTRNEIDVMCVAGTMPVFISCKMASPSPLALSEIEVLCRRFGGEAARAVVVTAAEPRRDSPAIYQRAKDLGITLIGGDVLAHRQVGPVLAPCREMNGKEGTGYDTRQV